MMDELAKALVEIWDRLEMQLGRLRRNIGGESSRACA